MRYKMAVITTVMVVIFFSGFVYQQEYKPLNQVLRLHIIANSDWPEDQALKLKVRNAVVEAMRPEFQELANASAAKALVIKERDRIEMLARQVIAAEGYDYPVQVLLGEYDFPSKAYGDLILPKGRYEAVKIVIGAGEGQNWWCVLFPPLCMVSSTDKGISLSAPEEPVVMDWKCKALLPERLRSWIFAE